MDPIQRMSQANKDIYMKKVETLTFSHDIFFSQSVENCKASFKKQVAKNGGKLVELFIFVIVI